MSTPYTREFRITTTGADEIVELNYPSRCNLTHVNAVREGGGAIDLDLFARKFTSPQFSIYKICDDGNGDTLLVFFDEFSAVREGDEITVAGNSVAGYNTTHRVVSISDDGKEVLTDQSFTSEGTGGTAELAISTADQELYRVAPTLSGTSPLSTDVSATGDPVSYTNDDPLPNNNIGRKRKLYVKIANAATYRIKIDCVMIVAGEG